MASFNGELQRREIVPDWMEEQLPGFIADDGTYDHVGFIEFLQARGYPYAMEDYQNIEAWGVQLGQMLKQDELLEGDE